mgnify:FL=1
MKHDMLRKSKKNGQVWVSAILYLLISLVVVFLVLQSGLPLLKNMNDRSYFEKTKSNFVEIDKVIQQVVSEGEGSQRTIPLEIRKGKIDLEDNFLHWGFETEAEILGHKATVTEGNLVTTADNDVSCKEYENYFIVENTYLLVILKRKGDENNQVQLNSSRLINSIKWKKTNSTVESGFVFLINNDPESGLGQGYTKMVECKSGGAHYKAYFNNVSSSIGEGLNYELSLKMDARADYIKPGLKLK